MAAAKVNNKPDQGLLNRLIILHIRIYQLFKIVKYKYILRTKHSPIIIIIISYKQVIIFWAEIF